jgi:Cys-tRNA(Pro)/Cys-tRNA(Cys) deacylase
VDESASDYPSIFVSGGRRGLDLEVAPSDLVRLLDAKSGAIAITDV